MALTNKTPLISIIIPVYNEAEHISDVINQVKSLTLDYEIIVVDDCSTDGTGEILRSIPDIRITRHKYNQGKGAAVRSGLSLSRGQFTIIQDADLEYPPEFIPRLLANIGPSYAIYGSRIKGKGHFLLSSYLANRFLSLLTSVLYRSPISDMETCYKLIRTDLLKTLGLSANRFEIEPEITAKILRRGIRIKEIPIRYQARKVGKKIGPIDGLMAIWSLIKWRFKR